MRIAVGFGCLLVALALAVPDDDQALDINDDDIKRMQKNGKFDKPACTELTGKCIAVGDGCQGEWKIGNKYCKRPNKYGCCVPPPPSELEIKIITLEEQINNLTNINIKLTIEVNSIRDDISTFFSNISSILKVIRKNQVSDGPTSSTCPSCPGVTECITASTATGALSTTTTEIITTQRVPAGFEDFHGRVIRRPVRSDTKYKNWDDAMRFCSAQFGAGSQPFIPQTSADYDLYRQVRSTLSNSGFSMGYLWLPASDSLVEGTLRWVTDGQVATNLDLWKWYDGQVLSGNSESKDCLLYGQGMGPKVHMLECSRNSAYYPPICEIV